MASHVAPVFYHGTTTSILKRRQQRNQQQLQQQQSSSSSDVGVSQSIRLAGGYDLLHARAAVRKAFTKQQQQDTCSQGMYSKNI